MKLYLMHIERFLLSSASSRLPASTAKQRSHRVKELKTISTQQQTQQKALLSDVSYKLVDINEIRYFIEVSGFRRLFIIFSKNLKFLS